MTNPKDRPDLPERSISASVFRTKCLELLDEPPARRSSSRRGRPIARLGPARQHPSLLGSVTYNVSEEELIYGSLAEWDVDRP